MIRVRRLPTGVLLAFALVAAAFAGALIGQVNLVGADVTSGDKPVNINVNTFRIRDTRSTFGGPIGGPATKLGTAATEVIQVAGTNGIPITASAVCVNVTVLDATTTSFVTVYGADPLPNASTVNPTPGGTFFNGVIVPLDSNGRLRVYNNAGSVNYFLDISCYYDDHNHDDRYGVGAVSTATGTDIVSTTSQSYVNVPGASTSIATSAPNERLLITFSTEVDCDDGVGTSVYCSVRVLVDGTPVSPSSGSSDVIFDTGNHGLDSDWGSHSHQWVSPPLGTGVHNIQVQYKVDESPATFYLDTWTLSAVAYR